MPNVYCVSLKGKSINDEVRTALFDTAQEMITKKKNAQCAKVNDTKLQITTKFEHRYIGIASGIIFTATVEKGKDKTEVIFIVRPGEDPNHEDSWTCGPIKKPSDRPVKHDISHYDSGSLYDFDYLP